MKVLCDVGLLNLWSPGPLAELPSVKSSELNVVELSRLSLRPFHRDCRAVYPGDKEKTVWTYSTALAYCTGKMFVIALSPSSFAA